MTTPMKKQTPAQGILLNRSWGDAMSYSIPCSCGCDNVHNMWIEADDVGVVVNIYTKQRTNQIKTRWQHIWTLLTKGYVEVESDVLLTEQQALNYASALTQSIKDVQNFKKVS